MGQHLTEAFRNNQTEDVISVKVGKRDGKTRLKQDPETKPALIEVH